MALGLPEYSLLFVLFIVFPITVLLNWSSLQPNVWASMQGWQYLLYALLAVGTLVSFSWGIPDSNLRRAIPWLGMMYIPITFVYLFWSMEISLFIWSMRFYASTIAGNGSFWGWFFCGFTPIVSISCLGGGFGAVMIGFTFPFWIVGCSLLGFLYYALASSGAPQLAVVLSCALKVGLLLVAPANGFLGGEEISQHESPSADHISADACRT
jgi:hypothetical protein